MDTIAAAGASGIIVTGAGRTFAAGADAREFGQPPISSHLPDLPARLERLPAIAAITGAALGGVGWKSPWPAG